MISVGNSTENALSNGTADVSSTQTEPAPLETEKAETPNTERVGKRNIIIITGLSGAGLSVALKALEDRGCEAVDNLRLSLVPLLIQSGETLSEENSRRPLALVIDSRTRDFSAEAFLSHLRLLKSRLDLQTQVLFLDCSDEVLQRRFTETRRRHPLTADRPVADGIQRERALLAPLRECADVTVDTTQLSIHELRRILSGHFRLDKESSLQIFVTSFSYRQGVPREADLVFDVRFLANPHYEPALRPLSGLDAAVAERVAGDPDFPDFFRSLTGLLQPLLPRYSREGKSYLTLAVGCTGGRHRSVFVAERLSAWLGEIGYPVGLSHRDLERAGSRAG
ncbi:RNase adaptor protein RapZ [Azospirillaceae bacterium]